MRGSITKLRWLLLGGFVLLAIAVAGFFAAARYKAGLVWQRILARNGVNLRHETNGITYSQSSHGRTVFTLHAGKAKPEGKSKMLLEDAMLILYGREPGRDDRIYGKQFEYDQDGGILRAVGEVHMDLQAPEPGGKPPAAGTSPALTFGPETETSAAPGLIHVRTSGLVYMRKLGIAATGQPAEFRFGDLTCTSTGAEFDTGQSVVRLLADVHIAGTFKKAAFVLNAQHAELNQQENTALLTTAQLTSGERSARASETSLHLHKDGTLAAAEASGVVELHSGTQLLAAPRMTVTFAEANRPQHAQLFTGVRFLDTDQVKPAQGRAESVDLVWLPNGTLSSAKAAQQVSFSQSSPARNGATLRRQASAEQAVADFVPLDGKGQKAALRRLTLAGSAQISTTTSVLAGRPVPQTAIAGDQLVTEFLPGAGGEPQVQVLHGTGHTRLSQQQTNGAHQQSSGDTLEVTFAPATQPEPAASLEASSAVQAGHVELRSWAAPKEHAMEETASDLTSGTADRALFNQEHHTLTLTASEGQAHLQSAGGELAAHQIVLHQDSGDAEAEGQITATSVGRDGSPASHILASQVRMLHASGLSIFAGTPDHPARMWQGASEVEANELTLDSKAHTLAARPGPGASEVRAIFAAGESTRATHSTGVPATSPSVTKTRNPLLAGQGVSAADRDALRVSADRMDYNDLRREATFLGQVRMSGATGNASAEHATVFLQPARPEHGVSAVTPASGSLLVPAPALGGTLDRLILDGQVRLTQPGRTGTGEQLTYTAATESFVLTGTAAKPPRVTGEQGSEVTGATLLFKKDDNTVVVAGAKGERRPAGSPRVHAETDLR